MNRPTRPLAWLCALVLCSSPALVADQIWNESDDGELSDDATQPTLLSPAGVRSTVRGTVGGAPGEDSHDAVALVLAPGERLAEVFLRGYTADANLASSFSFYLGDEGSDGSLLGTINAGETEVGSDLMALAGAADVVGPDRVSLVIQENLPNQQWEVEFRLRRTVQRDELVGGDLSSNPTSPSLTNLVPGRSQLVGSVGDSDPSDAARFEVPSGATLDAVNLTALYPTPTAGSITLELYDGPSSASPLIASDTVDAGDVGVLDLLAGSPEGPGLYTLVASDGDPDNEYSVELRTTTGSGWDELAAGDLPDDGVPAAAVPTNRGHNRVQGTTGGPDDSDLFTVSLPSGQQILSLRLTRFVGQLGNLTADLEVYDGTPASGSLELSSPLGHAEYGRNLISSATLPSGPATLGFRIGESDLGAADWDLELRIDHQPVFTDGFESGDTTAW